MQKGALVITKVKDAKGYSVWLCTEEERVHVGGGDEYSDAIEFIARYRALESKAKDLESFYVNGE